MSRSKNILCGIDYSLQSPSICIFSGQEFSFNSCSFFYLTNTKKYAGKVLPNIQGDAYPTSYKNDTERYLKLSDWCMSHIIHHQVNHISLEGYSMGSRGRVFNIAENTQTLKLGFYFSKIPNEIYTPSQIKKFATGKGNANKDQMHNAFIEETGVNLFKIITPDKKSVTNPVCDIVDSYYICKFLYHSLMPKYSS